ncbi:heme peroxidase family protein [uncultured Croceitalea sp.]|uniref:peroxidase family protein n=1 Tax=uncultured Croceitalea sp. TaxID=1798908 RepID=UPI003305FA1B
MKKFGHGYSISKKWFSRNYLAHCTDTFGFMFPGLARKKQKIIKYSPSNRTLLEALGQEMGTKPNTNEIDIPAGYTYLGQFIDHDITLDPFSNIDRHQKPNEVEKLNNFRTPTLDLDSVYGNGPSVDPYLYVNNSGDSQEDGIKLLLGTNTNKGPGGPRDGSGSHIVRTDFDVPRTSNQTAIIGDPRNNENLFVSQIHHAFLKFHNKVVDRLKGTIPDEKLFETARKNVVNHYQWIVVHDFLKRILLPDELKKALKKQRYFRRRPFSMPVEFSVAAYRFGHSLVREEYDFNDNFNSVNGVNNFMRAFQFIRVPHLPVESTWVVDLNRFFDTGNSPTLNKAMAFDTAMAPALSSLPGAPPASFMAHLAKRNLVRSMALNVPTGQAIAKRLRVGRLSDSQLLANTTTIEKDTLEANNKFLLKNTPLWYYVLKEAEIQENGKNLGKVGSIIVAETFTRILRDNPDSILCTGFKPDLPRISSKPSGDFDMADLLNFAEVLS